MTDELATKPQYDQGQEFHVVPVEVTRHARVCENDAARRSCSLADPYDQGLVCHPHVSLKASECVTETLG